MSGQQIHLHKFITPAVLGFALMSVVVSLSVAQDIPKQNTTKKVSKKRAMTLAEAMKASQSKRQPIEFIKPDGGRGVLQQRVFDLNSEKKKVVQIALVVDGTDSMGQDLGSLKEGLKGFISKIRERSSGSSDSDGQLTQLAVIVYRDLGSPSGSVTIVTPKDESNKGIFLSASGSEMFDSVDSITTESGAPRFPEQVDRGLYAAINDLNWNVDASRSIILAGDAPPFDEAEMKTKEPGFNDVLRMHSNSELVAAAKSKEIKIFSILCNAGFSQNNDPQLLRVAALSRPKMRSFANALATETGGKVLDLSNPRLAEELLDDSLSLEPLTKLKQIEKIELDEIEKRQKSEVVRIAVLPSVPMAVLKEGTAGWPKTTGYTYACALVNRLSEVDSRGVVNMSPVLWDKFSLVILRAAGKPNVTDTDILKDLASAESLDLDYILWGEYPNKPDGHEVTLRAFDRNGVEVAKTGVVKGKTLMQLVVPSLKELAEQLTAVKSDRPSEQARIASLSKLLAAPNQRKEDEGWNESLLESYRLLEEASAYEFGNEKGRELNEKAKQILNGFLKMVDHDPLALMLRSSCHRNLGDIEQANQDLIDANMYRNQANDDALALEIQADHMLFIDKDALGAVTKYEALVSQNETSSRVYCRQALRAKWMLSGLYLGGWGFGDTANFKQEVVKYLERSRELLLEILVYWPESPEAEYYERYVEPRPIHTPRRRDSKRTISFKLPASINPPKNGGRVALLEKKYDEDGSAPGT